MNEINNLLAERDQLNIALTEARAEVERLRTELADSEQTHGKRLAEAIEAYRAEHNITFEAHTAVFCVLNDMRRLVLGQPSPKPRRRAVANG